MGTAEQHGWRIAEVERLVSLSRRDIQRTCYQGRGGAGVLTPSDGSWGRRTYDERDLATLFLLAQRRRERLTLSQAADDLRERLRDHSQQELLALEAEKLSDRLADVADQLVRAEALNAALEDEPQRSKLLSHIGDCAQELGRASSGLECPPPPTDDSPGEELLQKLMKSQGIEEPE